MRQFAEFWQQSPLVLLAVGGLFTAFGYWVNRWTPARTAAESHAESVNIDADMVRQFIELATRLSTVELAHAETVRELRETQAEVAELKKSEAYLQARLHQRGKEIDDKEEHLQRLERRLETYRRRLKALEDLVRDRLGEDALYGLPEAEADDHTGELDEVPE